MECETHGYARLNPGLVQRLLRWPLVALLAHWTFQSLFYMDATERWFKLCLDAVLAAVLGALLLGLGLPWLSASISALLLAHTLNFYFNGHIWGVLKHYGFVHWSFDAYEAYAKALALRIQRSPAIQCAVVCGSLSRQDWSPSSDLDVRMVRNPGLYNGVLACFAVMRERSRAALAGFPLDAYVFDDISKLKVSSSEDGYVELSSLVGTNDEEKETSS